MPLPRAARAGVRTIFNILGPLTNPAGAPNQVMGVFHPGLVDVLARVLARLGSRHAMTVYGMGGAGRDFRLRRNHGGRTEGRQD